MVALLLVMAPLEASVKTRQREAQTIQTAAKLLLKQDNTTSHVRVNGLLSPVRHHGKFAASPDIRRSVTIAVFAEGSSS